MENLAAKLAGNVFGINFPAILACPWYTLFEQNPINVIVDA